MDSAGRLLAVEVKPKNTGTIVWSGVQATVYARLFERWVHAPALTFVKDVDVRAGVRADVPRAGIASREFATSREGVDLGDQGVVHREYLRHPGAVGVLALDDDERVTLVRQYRHPARHELWELPAGLLDVDGEPPLEAAQRELAAEADLRAGRWDVLVDWFNSPGGSDEAIRVYLARDLSSVPDAELHEREHEEAGMPTATFSLDEVRSAVLAGRVHTPTAVVGVLAACAARDAGWSTLRPG